MHIHPSLSPSLSPSLINHAGFSGGKASSKFNGNCMHQYGRHHRHAPAAWPDPEQRGTVCALCQCVDSVTRTSRLLPSPTCTNLANELRAATVVSLRQSLAASVCACWYVQQTEINILLIVFFLKIKKKIKVRTRNTTS